jgi:hypothetical protein
MALKLTVAGEAEPANDANDGRGIGMEALGHCAHAEEHVFTGMLEDGPNDFLAFDAELLDALSKMPSG